MKKIILKKTSFFIYSGKHWNDMFEFELNFKDGVFYIVLFYVCFEINW